MILVYIVYLIFIRSKRFFAFSIKTSHNLIIKFLINSLKLNRFILIIIKSLIKKIIIYRINKYFRIYYFIILLFEIEKRLYNNIVEKFIIIAKII